jgi:hypothetical protein
MQRQVSAFSLIMRVSFAIILLLGVSVWANAQDKSTGAQSFMTLVASNEVQTLAHGAKTGEGFSAPYGVQREMYRIPQAPGERMMKVGQVLTAFGAISVISGILVYNNADPNYYTHGTYGNTYGEDPHIAGGQLLVGAGIGLIVPGVMVWIHGASKFRKYEEKTTQALYIPGGKLGLGYRF